MEIAVSKSPPNVLHNFRTHNGLLDYSESILAYRTRRDVELAKYNASISECGDYYIFNTESDYTFFILRWS
jgi:hypothetical protein